MKALILNSGLGRRMGNLTSDMPKCMTEIGENGETILSRQLECLANLGITEVVMTTGYCHGLLEEYCNSLQLPMKFAFVNNPDYDKTNYIYSIYCAREELDDDILLLHGDLVFDFLLLKEMLEKKESCMIVSSTKELPQKDFKAVIREGKVQQVGIEFFDNSLAAWPMYKLNKEDWKIWLEEIVAFCEAGNKDCYAEKALNEISDRCQIVPFDMEERLCAEIDTKEDLEKVQKELYEAKQKLVYVSFSADILHSGHMILIKRAAMCGKVIVGVLTDEVVASYRKFPLIPFEERKALFENIKGVYKVVKQDELSCKKNIAKYSPDYVVHGDEWKTNMLSLLREETIELLKQYGGRLIEFAYSNSEKYVELDKRRIAELSMPDYRRGRLKKLIEMKGLVTAIEAHSGLTGLIAEKTVVYKEGQAFSFDAMWVSSLCDSTAKGKPDIELVDLTSRCRTIDDIMEVTTKPIIFDGDTGGLIEHFVYTVRTLERMGVSMVIIEDKNGLKKNSLFGTEVAQTQDSIENFCQKITAGKNAKKTEDFMIVARIESLILEKGMEDALERAESYVNAGADGIMIHSRRKEPDEIFEFIEKFREKDEKTPIIVVPTSFNSVTEEEFKRRGVNVVIYANQLTRSGFPAMQNAAIKILENHRCKEADEAYCMSIKEIINLIPEE